MVVLDSLTVDLLSVLLALIIPVGGSLLTGLNVLSWPLIVTAAVCIIGLRLRYPAPKSPLAPPGAWALVTGSSSGIGQDLARVLAKHGWNIIVHGRNAQRLEDTLRELRDEYNVQAEVIAADLEKPGAAKKLWEEAMRISSGNVQLLVNNAGFGKLAPYIEEPLEELEGMIAVNVTSLATLCRLALEDMTTKRRGAILNVASTAGFQPGPYFATYYATKAFVVSLSEALYMEARNSGVLVSCLCPGPVETRFGALAGNDRSVLFQYGLVQSSKEVAEEAYKGLLRGDRIIIPGANLVTVLFAKFAPRSITLVAARIANYVKAGERAASEGPAVESKAAGR